VRLFTRNGYDWTKRYPWIVESALKNRQKHFVTLPSRYGSDMADGKWSICGPLRSIPNRDVRRRSVLTPA
jgi:hypothetical protein